MQTSLIKSTTCYMFGLSDEKLNQYVDEIKSFLVKSGIPDTYTVNVYKDRVTCCGNFLFGVAFEIKGPKMQRIKDLDKTIINKIKEICKRESIDCQECQHQGVILDVEGSAFAQDEV